MKRRIELLAALSFLAALVSDRASAQYQPRPPSLRPAVSPWLNLTREGQPPGLNYYNLVRPEVEFRTAIQQLQQQTTAEQQTISALEASSALPATGHAVGFQTQGRYFLNLGKGGPGALRFGTAPLVGGTAPLVGGATAPQLPAAAQGRR
jgi:hypothetical protein